MRPGANNCRANTNPRRWCYNTASPLHTPPARSLPMSMTRRRLVALTAGLAATALVPRMVFAQAQAPAAGPFRRDPLPYPVNALEPHIDAKTMEIHPGRHHEAYVSNLNTIAKDNPQIAQKPIPEVLAKLNELPEAIRTIDRKSTRLNSSHLGISYAV